MTKYELTDALIRQSFEANGIDEKYFPMYEAEVKRVYKELQVEEPDSEESTDDDNNVVSSLGLTDDYIRYYSEEAEKGHGPQWCNLVASDSVTGGDEYHIYLNAYNSLETEAEKEFELNVHINSYNVDDDPIFRERFKHLFLEYSSAPKEKAEEYASAYNDCISNGKSEIYAKAFAEAVNMNYYEEFCTVHAEAYELAILHGMQDYEAFAFGETCTTACDFGYLVEMDSFLKQYHENWQKEFYIHLICKDYEQQKRPLTERDVEELRKRASI